MITDLKACYSPADLVFIVSLFILSMFAMGAFVVLMVHAIRGALEEVDLIRKRKQAS